MGTDLSPRDSAAIELLADGAWKAIFVSAILDTVGSEVFCRIEYKCGEAWMTEFGSKGVVSVVTNVDNVLI